jgi:hypothetical protein
MPLKPHTELDLNAANGIKSPMNEMDNAYSNTLHIRGGVWVGQ